MPAVYYPSANRTAQWFGDTYPGSDMGGVEKVLLHSTETGGWPGYDGGASAPNLTYHPILRQWRQHFRLDRSARALRDPAGTVVRENRDKVVQVEIIGTCDPVAHRAYPSRAYTPELSDAALDDLGAFLAFMHREWGVPLVAAPLWLPYPASYGASRARMSGPTYDSFRGLLAHQHASGNSHGDALLDAAGIVRRATTIVRPPAPVTVPVSTEGDDMFIGTTKSDGRVWLFSGGTRKYIPTPTLLDELVRVDKIPNRGVVSPGLAALYPIDTGNAEATWRTQVTASLARLTDRLGAVERDVADDATTAQVSTVRTELAELAELVAGGPAEPSASA